MAEERNINTIGKDFTTWELIKFVGSPVATNFVMSMLQNIDDGLFLSRFVGKEALAAFNLCFPIFMLIDAVAMMLASISIYCATRMGEGRNKEANSAFTTIAFCMYGFGSFITICMIIGLRPLLSFLGVTEAIFPYAWDFFSISRWYIPLNMATYIYSRFYVIAGKPKYSTVTMLMTAFCNFFFDWLFMAKLHLGIRGSSFANFISVFSVNIFGLIFYNSKQAEVRFSKPSKNVLYLLATTVRYGFTDMMTSFAIALNSLVSNYVLLDLAGESVISASSIVNGIQFAFCSAFFGLMGATSPLVSYAYGEKNKEKLVKVLKQVLTIGALLLLLILILFYFSKDLILNLYLSGNEPQDYRDTVREGLSYAPLVYPFMFFNIYVQVMFMAVNRSRPATILSFLENILFCNLTVLILPRLFGLTGFWLAISVAEMLTIAFSLFYIWKYRNAYGYGKSGIATELA